MSLSFNNDKAVKAYAAKTELFQIEKELFNEHLHGRVLDLGCGCGRTTRHIHNMGYDVVGVDIAPLLIESAQSLHPDIKFKVGDATHLEYLDESFDTVVFSFNGLDYLYPLENRLQALNEIRRVLKPGGCFMYSSHEQPLIKKLPIRRRLRIHRFDPPYYREITKHGIHVTYYGLVSCNSRHLKQAGFKDVLVCDPMGHAWRYYVAWV